MGCFSSKVRFRSCSSDEELGLDFQRTWGQNGSQVIRNVLLCKNGGDHLLALVCIAKRGNKKLQSPTATVKSDVIQAVNEAVPQIINASEFAAICEEKAGGGEVSKRQADHIGFPWSRSRSEILRRCLSFHTVEEFDALIRWKQKTARAYSKSFSETLTHTDCKICLPTGTGGEKHPVRDRERGGIEAEQDQVCLRNSAHLDFKCLQNADGSGGELRRAADSVEGSFNCSRPKAVATDLTNLNVTSIDFESLDHSLDLKSEMSDNEGSVTPKFGSYKLRRRCGGDVNVIDPDLVEAFELSMKEMKEAEEIVLEQILVKLGEYDADQEATGGSL